MSEPCSSELSRVPWSPTRDIPAKPWGRSTNMFAIRSLSPLTKMKQASKWSLPKLLSPKVNVPRSTRSVDREGCAQSLAVIVSADTTYCCTVTAKGSRMDCLRDRVHIGLSKATAPPHISAAGQLKGFSDQMLVPHISFFVCQCNKEIPIKVGKYSWW